MTAQVPKEMEKLTNTVLYLLRGCAPARPSTTSLLKLVWYADYEHYRKHLAPITGANYVALERGPVLDQYKQILDMLEQENVVKRIKEPVQGHPDQPKIEFVPQAAPDETVFLESEIEVLDEVIRTCGGKSGNELSERTHREGPWSFAWNPERPGQPIPYVAFRWVENLPDEREAALARESVAGMEARIAELNAAQ